MKPHSESADSTSLRYIRVQEYILDMIHRGEFGPGDKIPSERVLADLLSVSRMTARKGVELLVAEGVLARSGNLGTIVPIPKITRTMDRQASGGMEALIRRSGGTPSRRLLHSGISEASTKIAARLQIGEGAEVLVVRSLHSSDGVPFCVETQYIPADLSKNVTDDDILSGGDVSVTLAEKFGVVAVKTSRSISVGVASASEAEMLKLTASSPVLLLSVVVLDHESRPIQYFTSVNHPGLVSFETSAEQSAGDGR